MKKAQSTIEAMIAFAVLIILFTSIFVYASLIEKDVWRNKTRIYAKDLCDDVGWSINQVYQSGEGSSSFVYLPEHLPGKIDYNMTIYIESQLIQIQWFEKRYFIHLLTSDISGNFAPALNIELQPGRLNISNDGGIFLEQ